MSHTLDHTYVPAVGDIVTIERTMTDSLSTTEAKWIVKFHTKTVVAMWITPDDMNHVSRGTYIGGYWETWSSAALFKKVWIASLDPKHPEAIAGESLKARGMPNFHTLTKHDTLDEALEAIDMDPHGAGDQPYRRHQLSID